MNSPIHSSTVRPGTQSSDILTNVDSGPVTENSPTDRQDSSITQETPLRNLHPLDQAQNKSTKAFDDRAMVRSLSSSPNLLGIDFDCRMIILNHLLVNRKRRFIDDGRKFYGEVELEGPAQDLNFVEYGTLAFASFPYLPRVAHQQGKDIPTSIAGARILRVCRQLYHEGVPVLYGKNSFVFHSYQSHDFSVQRHLSKLSTSSIKKLTVGMPMKNTNHIETKVQSYVKTLEEDLPSLCELTLTSEFLDPHRKWHGEPPRTRLEVEHRVMLCTAAYIALHHATLGTAIWDARSGLMPANELNRKRRPYRQQRYKLAVRILARNHTVELKEQRTQHGLPRIEEVVTRDFVLDCHAITQVRLADMIGRSPPEFALPDRSSAAAVSAS